MSLIIDSIAAVQVICCVLALAIGLPVLVAGFWLAGHKLFRNWRRGHISCMVFSYYPLLAGGVNEASLHLPVFDYLTLDERFTSDAYGISHTIVFLKFQVVFVGFLRRHRPKHDLTT